MLHKKFLVVNSFKLLLDFVPKTDTHIQRGSVGSVWDNFMSINSPDMMMLFHLKLSNVLNRSCILKVYMCIWCRILMFGS